MEASVCKMRVSLKMQLIFCSVIYSRKEYIVLFNYFLKKCTRSFPLLPQTESNSVANPALIRGPCLHASCLIEVMS